MWWWRTLARWAESINNFFYIMLEVKFSLYISVWYVWQQWISLQNIILISVEVEIRTFIHILMRKEYFCHLYVDLWLIMHFSTYTYTNGINIRWLMKFMSYKHDVELFFMSGGRISTHCWTKANGKTAGRCNFFFSLFCWNSLNDGSETFTRIYFLFQFKWLFRM